MTESNEITPYLDRIIKLPHWDRVAFAAFCGRLVLPFYGAVLKEEDYDNRTMLLWNGIAALEHSAERGKPSTDPEKMRINFTIARGAVRRAVNGRDDESTPTEEEEQELAISEQVVDICDYAVETLQSSESDSSTPAFMAYFWTENLLKQFGLIQMIGVADAALEWLEGHPFRKRRLGRSGASLNRFRDRIGEIVDSM